MDLDPAQIRIPAAPPRRLRRLALAGRLAACLAAGLALPAEARVAVIRVAPQAGEDAADSIQRALDRTPALRARGTAVVVEIAAGLHRLARPLRIGGGGGDAPLTLRGAPGGTRLSGAVQLPAVEAPPPVGAPPEARAAIRSYRLPPALAAAPSAAVHRVHNAESPPAPFEVFDTAGALHPARWPDAGFARLSLSPVDRVPGKDGKPDFLRPGAEPVALVPEGRADRWRDEDDLWIAGYLGEDWSFETLPAVAAVKGSGRLALAGPSLYPLRQGDRFFAAHALSELDRPGEWWRDARAGLLYLIPRGAADIEASVSESLIEIADARHVRIEGLTLERVRGDAVRITGADDVILSGCTIRDAAGRGLVVADSRRSGIRRSVVADTGEGGVSLDGGDRARLVPAGNFVEESAILRFARLNRTYKPAVSIEGVGQRVSGSYLADAPHFAIRYQGNDHAITGNEIARVAAETSDSAAIYTGRDIAAQGSVIAGNFIHDVRPAPGFEVKGIYLDDMASGTAIRGNLFLRVEQPVFIGGGRDNRVEGNLFVEAAPFVYLDGRGRIWPSLRFDDPANPVLRNWQSMPTGSPAWRARYPRLADLLRDDPARARRNTIRGNAAVVSGTIVFEPGAEAADQILSGNRTLPAPRLAADAGPADLAPLAAEVPGLSLAGMDRLAALKALPEIGPRLVPELRPGPAIRAGRDPPSAKTDGRTTAFTGR